MSNKMTWFWGSRVAAAILLVAGVGSANAAVIRGTADPQFTGTGFLSGVYWSSTITFTVADSCIAGTGTSSCSVTVSSVTAALSPAASPGSPNTFPSFANPAPSLWSIHHTSGVVDAFDAPVIGPSATFFDPNPAFGGTASIDWGIDGNNLPTALFSINVSSCGLEDDRDVRRLTDGNTCTIGAFTSTIPARITIVTIPEPGALVLLLTALSAAWFVRRRAALRR